MPKTRTRSWPLPFLPYPYPSNFGISSLKYSTTASGPLSTCNPCGIACVLMSGTMLLAVSWIFAASSGDHIDAQNYKTHQHTHVLASSGQRGAQRTKTFGLCSVTVASTWSIAVVFLLAVSASMASSSVLTIGISNMNNGILILQVLRNAPDEPLRALGRSVHSDQSPCRIRHLVVSGSLACVLLICCSSVGRYQFSVLQVSVFWAIVL